MKTLNDVIKEVNSRDFPVYFETSGNLSFVLLEDYENEYILFDSDGLFSNDLNAYDIDDIVYIQTNYDIEGIRNFLMGLSVNYSKNVYYDCRDDENNEEECMRDPITKDIVKEFVEDWFKFKDWCTTLDIKNKLRESNYEANQSEVSLFMKNLYDEGFLNRSYNGNHYEYTKSTDDVEEEDEDDCSCTNCTCVGSSRIAIAKDNDWVAYFDKYTYIFVDGSLTRDKARVVGGHEFGYNHDDMRACRYKNFVKKNW